MNWVPQYSQAGLLPAYYIPPTISTNSLPSGQVNSAFSFTPAAFGGTPAYTWSISGLPSGLSFNSATGTISGTPTASGTFAVTASITDSLSVPSAPVSLSFSIQGQAGAGAPQAIFRGYADTQSVNFTWWGPTTQTGWTTGNPDYYKIYRDGVLICGGSTNTTGLTQPGVTQNDTLVFAGDGNHYPVNWYTDRTLPAGATHNYTVTAVTGGVESGASVALTMSTLANGTSTPPTTPTDPATWIQPFALPTGGTTWLVTNTSSTAVAGTGSVGQNGCSLQYAFNNSNINGGDLIVLSHGLSYLSPGTGYTLPAYTGTIGWTYIISDAEPVYNPGGGLIPYAYSAVNQGLSIYVCTTTIPSGATSATLTSVWPRKSGWYYVVFTEGTAQEERLVVFTQGSTAITWAANNGNYLSAGLKATANATIQVAYVPGVTPFDAPNMPAITFNTTNATGLSFPAAMTKVRFVGINLLPGVALAQQATALVHFMNSDFPGGPTGTQTPAESVYFDRCLGGSDTGSGSYSFCAHGIGYVNCNHLLVHQCWIWGIASNFNVSSGDANNFTFNGAFHCWQNNYLSAVAECHITGGGYVSQTNQPTQFVARYNMTHKPLGWTQGAMVPIATWTPGPGSSGATGLTLAANWPYASGAYQVAFSDGETKSATFTNGATGVTWSGGLTGASVALVFNAEGGTPYGLWGRETKNHWEQKAGTIYEYYGNLCLNNWVGRAAGYHGAAFALGARDQKLGSLGVTNITQTCTWNAVTDVYIHDNQCYNVASPLISFTNDSSPACYDARVKFRNNACFLNPPITNTEKVFGIRMQGPCADHILDQNTIIVNPAASVSQGQAISTYFIALVGGAGRYVAPGPVPFSPNPFTNFVDKLTYTNCIIDSGTPGAAIFKDTAYTALATLPNVTWGGNLTITDTQAYPTLVQYPNVPYASVGFSNYQGNTTIPLNPADWNVVTGTYATGSTTSGPVGATFPSGRFPQLGAYLIGGTVDFVNLSHIGNLQIAVFSNYPGYSAGGKNLQQQVAAVKALNPQMKICAIHNIMENNPSTAEFNTQDTADTLNNWYLKTTYPGGSQVFTSGTTKAVNITSPNLSASTTSPGGGGLTYRQWQGVYTISWGVTIAPNLDGHYTDNFNTSPAVSGDYAQNGTTQSQSAAQAAWQTAYVDWDTQLRASMGSSYMHWGNLATWDPGTTATYNGILNGGVMESIIGQSYSKETVSWVHMMQYYANVMGALAKFKGNGPYAIFQQDGASLTDYQGMRYGLTSCMLDNGYYHYNTAGQGGGNNVAWFDEMGQTLGPPIAGPNNLTNGTYSSGGLTVWQNGVWRRDFAFGIALVNPKGNGAQTVTLETTFHHFSGTQAPAINNGQPTTSVTLSDRDGVILLR